MGTGDGGWGKWGSGDLDGPGSCVSVCFRFLLEDRVSINDIGMSMLMLIDVFQKTLLVGSIDWVTVE